MSSRFLAGLIFVLISCLVLLLLAQNQTTVALSIFGVSLKMTVGTVLCTGYLLAYLAVSSLLATSYWGRSQAEKQLLSWQNQDLKLEAQVQSDREKQLEAKIATLEAALKQALKKTES